jgi:hypothetical protein
MALTGYCSPSVAEKWRSRHFLVKRPGRELLEIAGFREEEICFREGRGFALEPLALF